MPVVLKNPVLSEDIKINTEPTIVNLTPHTIRVKRGGGYITFQPAREPARIAVEYVGNTSIGGVPVTGIRYFDVENLPDSRPDTWFLVSRLVFETCISRTDLLCPDTSSPDVERRADGTPYSVPRLLGKL